MIVRIPSPLRSYTAQEAQVQGSGQSVLDVLADLDRRHPGIRFRMIDEQGRIREHIKLYVNSEQVDSLTVPISEQDTLHIICALSGG